MSAATEDRGDAYYNPRNASNYKHSVGIVSDETIYERTLVELDSNNDAKSLDHAGGDDDSSVDVFVSLDHYEEGYIPLGNVSYDRQGNTQYVDVYSGVELELDVTESDTTGYSLFQTAYAVDDATVSNGSADGSSGTYASAGTVTKINSAKNTVHVLVHGILE